MFETKVNDYLEKERLGIGSSILTVIAVSLLLTIIYLLFQEQILTAFGAKVNDETYRLSKEYFFCITLGIPFYMFGQALSQNSSRLSSRSLRVWQRDAFRLQDITSVHRKTPEYWD